MCKKDLYNNLLKIIVLQQAILCINSQQNNRCRGQDIGTKPGGTDVVYDGKINGYWKKDSVTSFYTDNAQELDYLYFNSKIINKENNSQLDLTHLPTNFTNGNSLKLDPVFRKESLNKYSLELEYGCNGINQFNGGVIEVHYQIMFPECLLELKWKKECLPFSETKDSLMITYIDKSDNSTLNIYDQGKLSPSFPVSTHHTGIQNFQQNYDQAVLLKSQDFSLEFFTLITDSKKFDLESIYSYPGGDVIKESKLKQLGEFDIMDIKLIYDEDLLEIEKSGSILEHKRISMFPSKLDLKVKCKYYTPEPKLNVEISLTIQLYMTYGVYFEIYCNNTSLPRMEKERNNHKNVKSLFKGIGIQQNNFSPGPMIIKPNSDIIKKGKEPNIAIEEDFNSNLIPQQNDKDAAQVNELIKKSQMQQNTQNHEPIFKPQNPINYETLKLTPIAPEKTEATVLENVKYQGQPVKNESYSIFSFVKMTIEDGVVLLIICLVFLQGYVLFLIFSKNTRYSFSSGTFERGSTNSLKGWQKKDDTVDILPTAEIEIFGVGGEILNTKSYGSI